MMSRKAPKDKIFEKVINPYLVGVLQYPESIEMREGMLHIRDVEGPKKTGSVKTRLKAMEQQVFKCQGMVERGLNANHMMITEFTNKHRIGANDIGKHLSRLYDRVDQLQTQIYEVQNQNCLSVFEASKTLRPMPSKEEAPSQSQTVSRLSGWRGGCWRGQATGHMEAKGKQKTEKRVGKQTGTMQMDEHMLHSKAFKCPQPEFIT
ncbi:40s ribosomal protein s5-1 [Hordeum vulgare]|nr:40s ribosomal protein s5-1 [Hordeum vulgare]